MFNVLPDNLKNKIKFEYKLRRVVVVFLFIFFIQICVTIAFFPTWLFSFFNEQEMVQELQKIDGESLLKEVQNTSTSISELNKKLNTLDKVFENLSAVSILENIIIQKNDTIRINEITYSSTQNNDSSIILRGIADDREALLSFVKNLESSGLFEKVNVPISNFAKNKNIDFSISLSIKKQTNE